MLFKNPGLMGNIQITFKLLFKLYFRLEERIIINILVKHLLLPQSAVSNIMHQKFSVIINHNLIDFKNKKIKKLRKNI